MNHIKRLTRDREQARAEVKAYEEGIAELVRYISSQKFQAAGELSGYVNVADIHARVADIRNHVADIALGFDAGTADTNNEPTRPDVSEPEWWRPSTNTALPSFRPQ